MDRLATPAPDFDDPLEMLAACHERIETHLATLERLAEQVAAGGSRAVAEAAARGVMRYFDTSGRQHHQDEDEDLFPLLRRLAGEQGRPEVAAAIEELEREHPSMEEQWGRLRHQLSEGRPAAEHVASFAWLYRRHMQQESAAVLPFAREALSASQRSALRRRMAGRRAAALPR